MADVQTRVAMLEEIAAQVRVCPLCRLSLSRRLAVPGEGSPTAEVMFIGEGPGADEDAQGRPFVGAAGRLLNELLAGIGLRREDVFITNIVKCRPPGNHEPLPGEIEACRDYLLGQIAIIGPRVICTLGRIAAQALVDPGFKITREHAQPRRKDGITYVPLYHPAAALHRTGLDQTLHQDMQVLRRILAEIHAESAAGT